MPSQSINNASPAVSHASLDMPRWMGESTALYNMNQGLAVSLQRFAIMSNYITHAIYSL
jgi:hypothetical protein